MALIVDGVGAGGGGAAVDGGAARGISNHHTIAEQLGNELDIRRLAAASAGAGELEQGLHELAALDSVLVEGDVRLRQLHGEFPVGFLHGGFGGQGLHFQGLGLGGAHFHAVAAAGAIQRAYLHAVGVASHFLADGLLGYEGSGHLGAFLHQDGTDAGVGANQGALAALYAVLGNPFGNLDGDAALFKLGGAGGNHAVGREGAHGQLIAFLIQDGLYDVLEVLGGLNHNGLRAGGGVGPFGGNLDFLQAGDGNVDGIPVLLNDGVALLAVGLLGIRLHVFIGLFVGDDIGQLEEGGLHDGVDAVAHANLSGQLDGVDDIELGVLLSQQLLHGGGQLSIQLALVPLAVEQEGAAVTQGGYHVVGGHISLVVAGDEIGRIDLVGAADGGIAKAQVADGQAAGLLGVVGEIGLRVLIGVVADDLDGILVGADGTVRAQTIELAGYGASGGGVELLPQLQGGAGQVVVDTHGEMILHFAFQVLVHGLHHGGGEFLAAQTIAAAHYLDIIAAGFTQHGADILVQRFAQGAGLLGAIQHGDLLAGGGDGGQEVLGAEGAEQMHLYAAVLLALRVEGFDGLVDGFAAAAHADDDFFSVGRAHVIKQVVLATGDGLYLLHALLNDFGSGQVVTVGGLTVLEVDIGVLGGTGLMGMFGVQRAGAELVYLVPGNDLGDVFVVDRVDLLDFMAGTEAIKEVQEGHAGLQRGQMGDQRHIHRFLNGGRSQHGKAGLAAGHDVLMIAEDGQGMGGQGAGRYMEHAGQQLAGDLVHVGDHQQQALGGGEGGGQRARGQRAVHGAGRAGFRLHFGNVNRLAKQVLAALRRPFVHILRHRGGRRDGVDRGDIAERIRDVADRSVTVDRVLERHLGILLYSVYRTLSGGIAIPTIPTIYYRYTPSPLSRATII